MTQDQPRVVAMEVEKPVNGAPVTMAMPAVLSLYELRQAIQMVERGVTSNEPRFITRALRALITLRHGMSARLLMLGIEKHMQQEATRDIKSILLKIIKELKVNDMDGDAESIKDKTEMDLPAAAPENEVKRASLPEVDVYMILLSLMFLLDKGFVSQGLDVSTAVVAYIQTLNRRSMDALAARSYFYYSRFYELEHRGSEIRGILLAAQRTATLRRDEELQATLLNLLLRNLLQARLFDQADKLISKTVFPEHAGSNQFVRYYYYLGRIKAIQLDYAEAYRHLQQAIIKAPQTSSTAGFLQTVHKFAILVQLLMGEMPDRSIFRQPFLRRSLAPYFELTQAVRVGDLVKFQTAMAHDAPKFRNDETYTLILRLRHNVIKTGLRMINLAYSRISLDDICTKLHLESREDAEYIIAKAIRDNVIEATLDHENGFMRSKDVVDVYATTEPLQMFNERIQFCLDLYNESVKALRFPKTSLRELLETPDQRRQREQFEKELMRELEEEDEGF